MAQRLFAIALIVPLLTSASYAEDCVVDAAATSGDPDPSNGGCTINGDDTITVLSGVTIETVNSHPLNFNVGGSASNVFAQNFGTIVTTGRGHGIRTRNISDVTIENHGTINANRAGILVQGVSDRASILNEGTITSATQDGIRTHNSDELTVINNGDITASSNNRSGVDLNDTAFSTFTNNGNIYSLGSRNAYGVSLDDFDNSTFINTGLIETTGDRNAPGVRGIDGTGMTVVNEGIIRTAGRGGDGLDMNRLVNSNIINRGTIETADRSAHGIYLRNAPGNVIENTGDIAVTGQNASAIRSHATDSSNAYDLTIINSGRLSATGTNGYAILASQQSPLTVYFQKGTVLEGGVRINEAFTAQNTNIYIEEGLNLTFEMDVRGGAFDQVQIHAENAIVIADSATEIVTIADLGAVTAQSDITRFGLSGLLADNTLIPDRGAFSVTGGLFSSSAGNGNAPYGGITTRFRGDWQGDDVKYRVHLGQTFYGSTGNFASEALDLTFGLLQSTSRANFGVEATLRVETTERFVGDDSAKGNTHILQVSPFVDTAFAFGTQARIGASLGLIGPQTFDFADDMADLTIQSRAFANIGASVQKNVAFNGRTYQVGVMANVGAEQGLEGTLAGFDFAEDKVIKREAEAFVRTNVAFFKGVLDVGASVTHDGRVTGSMFYNINF